MTTFDQVEHQVDLPLSRRASGDPLAMVGASRVVASGRLYRDRSAVITHAENGGMELLLSDILSSRSVRIRSMPGETRAQMIARGHVAFDEKHDGGEQR